MRAVSFLAALALSVTPAAAQMQGKGDNAPLGGGGGGLSSVTLNSVCPAGTQTGSTLNLNGQASILATNTSGAYTVASADCGKVVAFNLAGGTTITLPAASALSQGYVVTLANVGASGNGTVNCATNSTSLNGVTSSSCLTIAPNTSVTIYATNSTATAWQMMNSPIAPTIAGTHPGYKSTIWYQPLGIVSLVAGGAPALLTAYCTMGGIGQPNTGGTSLTISALGTRITTIGVTNTINLAIYNNDTTVSPNRPGTLIDSTGAITFASATSVSQAIGTPRSITPGFYWFCAQVPDTAIRYLAKIGTASDVSPMGLAGSATVANSLVASTVAGGVSTTTGIASYGTWPANMNGSTWTEVGTTAPDVVFQVN